MTHSTTRERDHETGTGRSVSEVHGPAHRAREGLDDPETNAETHRATVALALEAVEQMFAVRGWNPGALILDHELELRSIGADGDVDRPTRVADRVADQVV